jgi:1-deoxy-D-xylulose-5-phosphate synthase
LRKTGGISGFLRRSESPFDVFGAGHAGTSISAAVGLAQARDVRGESNKVVAVIGDGSMTCGLPFEALNNAGHSKTSMLVVLNDNEMSISDNVGALSQYFNYLVQSRFYNTSKATVKDAVKRAPLGEQLVKAIHRIEESAKGLIVPSIFFEDLGFRYIGPIDGHDLDVVVETLRRVKDLEGPILLHAITRKGKGYKLAEGDSIFWHSPPNFQVETGECKKSSARTWTHVYGETLEALAEKDPNVVAITAAMCTGTGLVNYSERFPRQFIDVGIAEGHAVTAAAGMAIAGVRPFVTIYSTFLQRGFDNIMHDVALQNLPVIFALDRSGLVGFDGPTHHGLLDVAYLRILPNMTVMAPKDVDELRSMMVTAWKHTIGPISIRYPRAGAAGAPVMNVEEVQPLEIGKAEVVEDGDGSICLISFGHIYANVMNAAALLAEQGIRAAVINARFAKPLDQNLLLSVAKQYLTLVTVEEAAAAGGFGSAVAEMFLEQGETNLPLILGVPDVWIEHGDQGVQQEWAELDPASIARRAWQRHLKHVGNTTGTNPSEQPTPASAMLTAALAPGTVQPLQPA